MSKVLADNIKRLAWRLSGKAFTPNQADIDALNGVTEWISREKEERLNDNVYFGKMVAWAYLHLLRNHDGDKAAVQREIQEILEKSLGYHYELLRMQIDMYSCLQAFEILGITNAWDVPKRDDGYRYLEDIRTKHAENKGLITEHRELLTEALKPIDFKYVSDNMHFFITELLNKYGNLP